MKKKKGLLFIELQDTKKKLSNKTAQAKRYCTICRKINCILLIALITFLQIGCNDKNAKPGNEIKKLPFKNSFFLKEKSFENMLGIPAGNFIMGTNPEEEKVYPDTFAFERTPYANESPKRVVFVDTFFIDVFEVTFDEYNNFLKATNRPRPEVWGDIDFGKRGKYPVFGVKWEDADAYAKWAGKRLPTEAEWEKAARGTDGRIFPWGNNISEKQISEMKWLHNTGSVAFDESPYGVMDMAGGVSEWTSDWYTKNTGSKDNDPQYGKKFRVARGFHYQGDQGHHIIDFFYRAAYRVVANPKDYQAKIGFRCVKSLSTKKKLKLVPISVPTASEGAQSSKE